MGLVVDSSLFISDEKGRFALSEFLASRHESAVIAAMTASELLHGCHRAPEGRWKRERLEYVEAALARFEIIPFGLAEARQHARISAALAAEGNAIGTPDLLIAATALSLGYAVATWNFRDFSRVPGLPLVGEQLLLPFRLR